MEEHSYATIVCCSCGHQIRVPIYCKNRFCPICSGPRRRRVQSRIHHLIDNAQLLPGQSLKFLTLTIRNVPNLDQGVTQLLKAFRKLRGRQFWRTKVSGGLYVIEVTGRPGNWHPHIHAVIQSWYLPQRKLSRHWESLTGAVCVYINERPRKIMKNYITKYITKADAPPDIIKMIGTELKSRRLFQPFGVWSSMRCPDTRRVIHCRRCGASHWLPWEYVSILFKDRGPPAADPLCHVRTFKRHH